MITNITVSGIGWYCQLHTQHSNSSVNWVVSDCSHTNTIKWGNCQNCSLFIISYRRIQSWSSDFEQNPLKIVWTAKSQKQRENFCTFHLASFWLFSQEGNKLCATWEFFFRQQKCITTYVYLCKTLVWHLTKS